MAGSAPRLPELDGVRGLAIVLVLIGHLFNGLMPEGAGFGVSLFFSLSGFLITSILIREYRARGAIDLKAFYLRRARRLLPALVVFLIATFGLRVYLTWITSTGYTYGALAAPIAFLLAAFFIGFAAVIGAHLNASIQHIHPVRLKDRRGVVEQAVGPRRLPAASSPRPTGP